MEWFTLNWLMNHLEWAVGILAFGCAILFIFPIILGLDMKKKTLDEQSMESIPLISLLIIVFAFIILGEQIKLKKEVRKLSKLTKKLKFEIEKVKNL